MSAACLQVTEVTLSYPGVEGEYCREDITLWSPEKGGVVPGVAAFMCDPECYHQVSMLMCGSGMHWDHGPQRDAVLDVVEEMEECDEEFDEEMEKWVNTHTFTDEEIEFFEKEIADMNRHHLRASAGPPTGEYWMNVSYDPETGLPDKNKRTGCWRYEDWCPELGRLSLISVPEDNGCFSTFNKDYVPFGIQWPEEIQEKTDGECEEKRFSGLKSCGSWMESEMDNEGRFIANGIVEKKGLLVTEYGNCFLQDFHIRKNNLKIGDEVKVLCRDADVLTDWAMPIKCAKVIRSGPGACEEFAPCGWY